MVLIQGDTQQINDYIYLGIILNRKENMQYEIKERVTNAPKIFMVWEDEI